MLRKNVFRSKTLALGLLAGFVLLVIPVGTYAADRNDPQVLSSLTGIVYGIGGKVPLQGAVVKIRNMANGKEFVSELADANGMYSISGIEAGWYFLSVTIDGTEYTLGTGFYLKAGDIAKMSLALQQGGTLEAWGSAYAMKKPFFSTAGGVAVIILGAAGAGFGLYSAFKKESDTSPVLLGR